MRKTTATDQKLAKRIKNRQNTVSSLMISPETGQRGIREAFQYEQEEALERQRTTLMVMEITREASGQRW